MGIYFPDAGTLGFVVWLGAGISHSQGIPTDLFTTHKCGTICSTTATSQHHTVSPCISVTPPLLPIWMNVASLNPWLLDFHIAQCSDSHACYLF